MIRNLWYAVLESKELGKNPLGVTRLGERLVFWRDSAGRPACLYDRCAHRGAALALGKICGNDIQCPFHGLRYNSSGRCVVIPANGKNAPVPPQFRMRSYPVHEAYGIIWIWWGENPPQNLEPPSFFEDLKDMTYWTSGKDPWDNHYTKVLENQLDVVHLPFIHHNTIGRGNRTLVEGPGLEWKGDTLFFVYPYNKKDDGSKPRTPAEVPVPPTDREFKLELIFPNIWENYISKKVRILGLFVPVDETHTLLYLRFYQSFMLIPGLRRLVGWLAMRFNFVVAHQDRRVVNTQIPKGDGIGKGELLIQGDHPIMEFRKKRMELRKAAENRA
jgi:phenylpropionate dioxygenase-like ring-hydroxylating dioxygenase large terminal subunit